MNNQISKLQLRMLRMALYLVIHILLSICTETMAQNTGSRDIPLTGTVTDAQGNPLEFANVVLISTADSTILGGCMTNSDGMFNLDVIHDNAAIHISMIGYQSVMISPKDLSSGPVVLRIAADILDEASVSAVLPKTEIKGDAVVTNIAGSVLEHSGNALEVLGKVPGMILMNGNIEVIGRGAPLYYINGRKVTDMSELRNLMSEDIRSIEVVGNPGAAYGGDVHSVVRIRTVKRQGDGFSFALSSQAKQHVYKNHDIEPSWSVLDMNYRKKGFDAFGKLVYWNQRRYQFSDIKSSTFTQKGDNINENSQSGQIYDREHSGGFQYVLGTNWQINENHSVGIKLDNSVGTIGDGQMKMDHDVFTNGTRIDHLAGTNTSLTSKNTSLSGNMYYDGIFDKVHVNFNGDFTRGVNNNSRDAHEESWKSPVDIKTSIEGQTTMGAGKLVVSFPIWKGIFQTGVEEVYVKAQQEYLINKMDIPSSNGSIRENTIAGFAEYGLQLPFGQISAGLRYEHVSFSYNDLIEPENNLSRVHDNLFPSLSFSTKAGSVNMNLSYTGKTLRPQFEQLTNEIYYENRFTYNMGDPLLESETHRNLALNVNHKWLTFSGTYMRMDNSIFQKAFPYNDEGIIIIKYSNADGPRRKLNLFLNASPVVGVWNPSYTIGMQKQFFSLDVTDPRVDGGHRTVAVNDPMFIIQANNAFRFKHGWLMNLDYQYLSPFGQMNIYIQNPIHTLNCAVSKSFLKDEALNVKLSWNDILDMNVMNVIGDYGNVAVNQRNDAYSPCIQLMLSYRFNTARSKYKGTGAGQDVKERMK